MDIPLYFFIAFEGMDRLSPGSMDTTLNAIQMTDVDSSLNLNILDIGCGVGSSTILLANYFKNSTIEAFDLFKHYIDVLDEKISENDLGDRVFVYEMDMNDPDFANEEFDIVFSEASVEIIGFKRGLKEWKRLLKPNGYLIISDVSWLEKPSSESRRFWKNTYFEVGTIENKISQIKQEGYEFVGYVVVPRDDWKKYYNQLETNLEKLNNDNSAKSFVNQLKKEIKTYRQNDNDYSYVFYVMKKI